MDDNINTFDNGDPGPSDRSWARAEYKKSKRNSGKAKDGRAKKARLLKKEICASLGLPLDTELHFIVRTKDTPHADGLVGTVPLADDATFEYYFRISSPGINVVVDKDTDEVVFIALLTPWDTMDPNLMRQSGFIFRHFYEDSQLHDKVSSNGAHKQGGGVMYAIGWRPGTVRGITFGVYHQGANVSDEEWQAVRRRDIGVHRIFSERFYGLAPHLFNDVQLQLASARLPVLGSAYQPTSATYQPVSRKERLRYDRKIMREARSAFKGSDIESDGEWCPDNWLFTSNLTFTLDNFFNAAHRDGDLSDWTYGMWAGCTMDGQIITDGSFQSRDGFFYMADYKVLVDFAHLDGLAEIVWAGRHHVHGTVSGQFAPGQTRYGSSCQLSRRLNERVQLYHRTLKEGLKEKMFTDTYASL
eukprot:TRINITY_DN682_c0_g2_i1.p1 TRINITY_DN682_c0_g2~~TRINITY_DN682_c0_g2_i1.p1  ORF type:complete len:415 (+),score=71.80 TRINITY_DN682_c0_g2_i1:62-1306(+)